MKKKHQSHLSKFKQSCDSVQLKQDTDSPTSNTLYYTHIIQTFLLVMCISITIFLALVTNTTKFTDLKI